MLINRKYLFPRLITHNNPRISYGKMFFNAPAVELELLEQESNEQEGVVWAGGIKGSAPIREMEKAEWKPFLNALDKGLPKGEDSPQLKLFDF
jgi:hypothetical protein